ncbi:SCP2 sterol-binding domain-containing protein [Nocardiopsis listeri]|uniref:SCP2 sterol-binding domain-containing protein n=1 Tax=Nocardiopsis listeri TaxID=53440 RepID=UPI00082C50B2|nr:SCP2 sterol-binding domain-containing protein [Nocardiopsis listeri]
MSSIDACLEGIARANERLLREPLDRRRKHIRERTVSVIVPDLDTAFDMRLTVDGLTAVTHRPRSAPAPAPAPQVTVTVSSEDLLALSEERLDPAKALFGRRLKIDASFGDLLRLRRLL